MIDLKRNSKKIPVKASGLRARETSSYKPNQTTDFKISRGRFFNFLICKRCFYLDRVKGLDPPGTPGWTLNETTDILLKKEFDHCRERQIPHRLFAPNGLSHVVTSKLFMSLVIYSLKYPSSHQYLMSEVASFILKSAAISQLPE